MQVILSRKGFDSSFGKGASPILPDGRLLSIPIPETEKYYGLEYDKLKFTGNKNYLDLMKELNLRIPQSRKCHLDPDLINNVKKRKPGWKAVFGQSGSAESHLRNQNVQKGDIFLFFGSFKRTHIRDKKLSFEKDYERHIIFGYLQIAEIVKLDNKRAENIKKGFPELNWAFNHPHLRNKSSINSLYIAEKSGVFKYNEKLVLTKKGYSKSIWELPCYFHPKFGTKISRHSNKERFRIDGEKLTLETIGLGQDFLVSGNEKIEKWCISLIENCETWA
ncbi:MAG: hypothetical protein KAU01_02770 [Candidatus Cloacimonetes bacterium]|nr:hypothetical protein [Candidatus Cloacimonadota bacterium]